MKLKIEDGKVECPMSGVDVNANKVCRGDYAKLHKNPCNHFGWEENFCIVCRYSEARERRLNGKYLTV